MPETIELLEPKTNERETTVTLPVERPRPSGFVIKPIDIAAAQATLDEFLRESDPEEDRATMEFLIKAIDEHRAAVGARLMFPDGKG